MADAGSPRILAGHTNRVYGVAYRPDGKRLASSGGDGTVREWEAASGKELSVLDGPTDLSSVVWDPRGKQFAASSAEGSVIIWEAESGARLAALWGRHPEPPGGIGEVAVESRRRNGF
jgi:WD40 repeat protein